MLTVLCFYHLIHWWVSVWTVSSSKFGPFSAPQAPILKVSLNTDLWEKYIPALSAKRRICTSLYGNNGRETVCSRAVSNNEAKLHDMSSSLVLCCVNEAWLIHLYSVSLEDTTKATSEFPEGKAFFVFTLSILIQTVVGPVTANLLFIIWSLHFKAPTPPPTSVETEMYKYRESGGRWNSMAQSTDIITLFTLRVHGPFAHPAQYECMWSSKLYNSMFA